MEQSDKCAVHQAMGHLYLAASALAMVESADLTATTEPILAQSVDAAQTLDMLLYPPSPQPAPPPPPPQAPPQHAPTRPATGGRRR